jgi:hypothetical protein
MRVCAVQMGWTRAGRLDGKGVGMSGSARSSMPLAAEIVDDLRKWFGDDLVNAQIRRAQAARKHYESLLASQGEDAARRWRLANWRECTFVATENGQSIGLADPFDEGVLPCVDVRELRKAGVVVDGKVPKGLNYGTH